MHFTNSDLAAAAYLKATPAANRNCKGCGKWLRSRDGALCRACDPECGSCYERQSAVGDELFEDDEFALICKGCWEWQQDDEHKERTS